MYLRGWLVLRIRSVRCSIYSSTAEDFTEDFNATRDAETVIVSVRGWGWTSVSVAHRSFSVNLAVLGPNALFSSSQQTGKVSRTLRVLNPAR